MVRDALTGYRSLGNGPGEAAAEAEPAAGEPSAEDGSGDLTDRGGMPAEVTGLAGSVAALDELADLPVAEHVARYDAVHGELSDALTSIDGV